MSAIEEGGPRAAGEDGKDTHGQRVGGVHPGFGLPHLPYGDAVHIMLGQAGLTPDVLEAGLRSEDPSRGPELFLTLSWLTGHPDLHDPAGLDLLWSHLTGWAARTGLDTKPLPVQDLAAPHVLADAVLHLVAYGLDGEFEPDGQLDRLDRWKGWRSLDADLNRAAERGQIAW